MQKTPLAIRVHPILMHDGVHCGATPQCIEGKSQYKYDCIIYHNQCSLDPYIRIIHYKGYIDKNLLRIPCPHFKLLNLCHHILSPPLLQKCFPSTMIENKPRVCQLIVSIHHFPNNGTTATTAITSSVIQISQQFTHKSLCKYSHLCYTIKTST